MGNCNFCHNHTLNQQQSVIQVDVSSPSKLSNQNIINSSILQPSTNISNKNASHPNLPSALTEETTDMNLLNKKITTPVPSAVSLSQKGKNCKKQNSRFSTLSNIANITIYVFGPIKSGKTSLVQTFWNGLLHPFNPNDPYIHSEVEEVIEKKFHSNSKQYDILFRIPNSKETNIRKNECLSDYFLLLFALNEIEQFEEAKEIYERMLNEYHHKKKNHGNNLIYSNVIMLGTKSDLEKVVKEEDINVYVKEKGLMYYEISLKDMKVLNLFLQMVVGFSEQNNLMFNKK